MVPCPVCDGKGGWREWGPYAWSNEDPDAPDAGHWTHHTCWKCRGSGEMSELAAKLYRLQYPGVPTKPITYA